MKTDARVRYTKNILRQALLKLLKERPLNRITVKEVCELAEVNRATFYKHFADCEDMLNNIEDDFLEEFRNSGKLEKWSDTDQFINAIYDTVDENKELCEVLIFSKKSPDLIFRMIDVAHERCIALWRASMTALTDRELDMLFTCIANGLAAVIYKYYRTCDRKTLTEFMGNVMKKALIPYAVK